MLANVTLYWPITLPLLHEYCTHTESLLNNRLCVLDADAHADAHADSDADSDAYNLGFVYLIQNVDLMLGQRRKWWDKVKTTLWWG